MDRLTLLTTAAERTRTLNEAFASSMSPFEVATQFAAEDIDLIIAWMEHHRADR